MDTLIASNQNIEREFYVTPNSVFYIKGFNKHLFLVYNYLLRLADNNTGQAYPSYATIAKRTFMSRNSAIKSIKQLIKIGLILKQTRTSKSTKEETKGQAYSSNLYTVLLPNENLVEEVETWTKTDDEENIMTVKEVQAKQPAPKPKKEVKKEYKNNYNNYNKNNNKKTNSFFNYNSNEYSDDFLDELGLNI